jgi:glycosyltransferase involved in cell wall biosynthesis
MINVIVLCGESNPSTIEKNHLIASGLCGLGLRIQMLSLCHDDRFASTYESLNKNISYVWDPGPAGLLFSGHSKLEKITRVFGLTKKLFDKLRERIFKDDDTIFIIPRDEYTITVIAIVMKYFYGCKLIANIMEYSPALTDYQRSLINMVNWHILLHLSDGFIAISNYLYKKLLLLRPTFYLPALIALKEINSEKISFNAPDIISMFDISHDIPLLLYTNDYLYRDLLQFSIDALSTIKDELFKVCITGYYPNEEREKWEKIIVKKGLEYRIFFSGLLSHEDFRYIEKKSTALLIPLLNNVRHIARFPQKTLRYMLMNKPIISTNVGEIAQYFSDGHSAYLDESITPTGYAKKIVQAIRSTERHAILAENARQVIIRNFDNNQNGLLLSFFLLQFVKKRP